LTSEQCQQLQGYLFSRAIPATGVPALIDWLAKAPNDLTPV